MINVWCLQRDQFAHTQPIEAALGDRATFAYDDQWNADAMLRAQPDVVLCVNDFPYEIAQCIEAARVHKIPSLVLQDGILEWRCQFENPIFGAGGGAAQHQPVIADKIACIGFQSARQIAAWGNAHKVEVTGMPRMDALVQRYHARAETGSTASRKPRVLVMTAKKPGFTPEQTAITLESLRAVKAYFAARADVDMVWRVTKQLDRELDVTNHLNALDSLDLVGVLEQVDAVISTPSTAMIESMLMHKPTAALDFHNTPHFVPTAWTISAAEQIGAVVDQLLNPTAAKLLYQRECLADALYLQPAAPRVAILIERMAQFGRNARADNIALKLPPALLEFELYSQQPVPLSALYPDQAVYQETDVAKLQQRLARLQKAHEQLKARAEHKNMGFWISAAGRYLSRRITKRGKSV